MANTKTVITRATALDLAMQAFDLLEREGLLEEITSVTCSDCKEPLKNLLVSITKKPKDADKPSKAAVENAQLAKAVFAEMQPNRAYSTSEIMSLVRGIMSTQKCAQVMSILVNAGAVTKGKDKKRVVYTLSDAN